MVQWFDGGMVQWLLHGVFMAERFECNVRDLFAGFNVDGSNSMSKRLCYPPPYYQGIQGVGGGPGQPFGAGSAHTTQGGFNQNGFTQGGFTQGGFNQNGFNQGGFNQGGFNQGGFNNPTFNQSGFNPGFDIGCVWR